MFRMQFWLHTIQKNVFVKNINEVPFQRKITTAQGAQIWKRIACSNFQDDFNNMSSHLGVNLAPLRPQWLPTVRFLIDLKLWIL
jgi:hypothetical protein